MKREWKSRQEFDDYMRNIQEEGIRLRHERRMETDPEYAWNYEFNRRIRRDGGLKGILPVDDDKQGSA